jgi:hypothetical protein
MHIYEFENRLEHIIADRVTKAYPYNWDENSITFGIVADFQTSFARCQLSGLPLEIDIACQAYKLRPPEETHFGDIGLIISARLRDGTVVEGAALIEAKLRHLKNNRFQQITIGQPRRIVRNAPHAMMMLYDYDKVPMYDAASSPYQPFWKIYQMRGAVAITQAPTVPLTLVAETRKSDRSLYDFACSPSFQFAHRYFQCLDLDFSKDAISAIKGFPGKIGRPAHIITIQVAAAGRELPHRAQINGEDFDQIETDRR